MAIEPSSAEGLEDLARASLCLRLRVSLSEGRVVFIVMGLASEGEILLQGFVVVRGKNQAIAVVAGRKCAGRGDKKEGGNMAGFGGQIGGTFKDFSRLAAIKTCFAFRWQ